MSRAAKPLQARRILEKSGKLLAASLLAVALTSNTALSKTYNVSLESRIWTSNLEDFEDLERAAVRALQLNPGAYEHYLVAELSFRMFKRNPHDLRFLKQASDLSQQAIEIAPNEEYGYLVASQVMDLMGYERDAAELLKNRPTFKQSWRTSFVRGVIASTHDRDKSSFQEFDTTLKAQDAPTQLIGAYLASNLESQYSGGELVQKLEIWNRKAGSPALKIALARALDETGDSAKAQAVLAELNKKESSDDSLLLEAKILYTHLNRYSDAEKILSRLNHQTQNPSVSHQAKAHLASISLHRKDMRSAARLFSEAIEASNEKLPLISYAHRIYKENNRLPEFAVLLDYLSTQVSGNSYLFALQGEVLSENLAQHEKAIESYSSAITLDPKRSEFYNGMGLAYYRMQKHDKALAVFNKAVAVDPKDATARYNEACVLALMGRQDEAVGSLRKAISLDGRLSKVALSDDDFQSLRKSDAFITLVGTDGDKALTKTP